MATTGFTITMQQVVDSALRKLGVNIQGGTATSTQVTEAIQAFNMMAKRFFTLGMPQYREYRHVIDTLVAGTNSYAVTPDVSSPTGGIYNVYQAYLIGTDEIEIPLRVISRDEYYMLVNKENTGTPTQLTMSADGKTAYLYLTPDAAAASNYDVVIHGYKQEDTYTAASDTIAFPQEWYEALLFGLCWRLAPEYGVDLETRREWKNDAKEALEDAMNWNPQMQSTYFGLSTYGYE